MAQANSEGPGRSHHGSNPHLLRQHEQHLPRNPVFHAQTKHIEVHYHFIRERVEAGEIDLQHVSTNLRLLTSSRRL